MYIQARIRKYVIGGADLPPPTLNRVKTTKRLKKTRPSRSDSKLAGSTQLIGIGQSRLNMITTETDQIWQKKSNLYYLVFCFCLCQYI